ncbi:GNAT family N-acetyltransferase [Planococcus soli]|uniref:GNAT family N-acetyltransferase n=1 Tax=Planococcus soli TaxID=2666072 RepID=UPI001FD3EE31|nr:GNAT family N-acetyltransferase [Planococcus soli]
MRIIKEIVSNQLDPTLVNLFSYVISQDRIAGEYEKYITSENRKLYGILVENNFIGIIGFEFTNLDVCEIRHIAVSPKFRGKRIGSDMINFVRESHSFMELSAETDKDAVGFYRNYGFAITRLGEKYVGVERFWCVFTEI